ncbi:hypothetical protein ACPDHJ_05885 [Myroides sp. C8-3]|uniref:hypothetical protein n=1 Tax=Myroides sp. C8-3 TaxID=3400533 RepID=UPI003D2F6587
MIKKIKGYILPDKKEEKNILIIETNENKTAYTKIAFIEVSSEVLKKHDPSLYLSDYESNNLINFLKNIASYSTPFILIKNTNYSVILDRLNESVVELYFEFSSDGNIIFKHKYSFINPFYKLDNTKSSNTQKTQINKKLGQLTNNKIDKKLGQLTNNKIDKK